MTNEKIIPNNTESVYFNKPTSVSKEKAYTLIEEARNKFPDAITEDEGATFKRDQRPVSKGCLACKSGEWLCIYIGMQCQLSCSWCTQASASHTPEFSKNVPTFATGGNIDTSKETQLEDIDLVISRNPQISGISFSGGEPLYYKDKIIKWSNYFRQKYPDIYLWLYTNGFLLNKNICHELVESGINEIRFDLAASDFSEDIINKISLARQYFDKVTVEVPVTEWNSHKLIGILPKLDSIGVDYLNLHDLVINSINYEILNKKHGLDKNNLYIDNRWKIIRYFPTTLEVYKVLEYIEQNQLKIITNDCNLLNSVNQLIGFYYQKVKSADSLMSGLLEQQGLGMSIFNLYIEGKIDKSAFESFTNFRNICKQLGYFP